MSLLALVSAKGSPGVTTAALALAAVWPTERRVLVAECDPAGSALAPRFGLDYEPGVTTLAPLARHVFTTVTLEGQIQTLRLGVGRPTTEVLVGPRSPEQAQGLARLWAKFAPAVAGIGDLDVLADCGRLAPASPTLEIVRHADLTVMFTRPDLEAVLHASLRLRALREAGMGARVGIVVVGDQPFPARAVADALEAPLVGALAHDRTTAAVFAGEAAPSHLRRRAPLLRSAQSLWDMLAPRLAGLAPRPSSGAREPMTAAR